MAMPHELFSFLQFRLQYSSLALLYYDFALTFPKEVQYMWKERFRVSTAIYIGCRYALIANVLYLLAIANKLGSTVFFNIVLCWHSLAYSVRLLVQDCWRTQYPGSRRRDRTYAVYGKNKWVLAYMSFVGLACVALDIISRSVARYRPMYLECAALDHRVFPSPEMLSILMVIFESSSAILTATRCVIAFRAGGGLENQRHGIMFILFEQGILYFCEHRLSCILTARFILHLREWDAEQVGKKSHTADVSVAEFRAASRSGALSSIVAMEDFGVDPVVVKRFHSDSEIETTEREGIEEGSGSQAGTSQSSNRGSSVNIFEYECILIQEVVNVSLFCI
ncbi:hypothetical protein C8J57DRAFT_1226390 [Mycena rebaudengoi]|nr:hypothetical protein C8J57DRAFT_1226390 [Mycena rebaudengoi]